VWAGRHVVVGVTGGIACYKSCQLVRRLADSGAQVDVVMTRGAAEFVRPLTFEALSGRPVLGSLWGPDRALVHVRLAHDADLVIVAPATAHLIARMARGFADDFLTAMLLARVKPAVIAPAMNDGMFAAAATQANLALLRERGVWIVGPEIGALAEGWSDRPGRMSEPEDILAHARRALGSRAPWVGKRVLVTAGPTREGLDPVRIITNRSSGKMGFRLAEAAWYRGAEVVLISGPSAEPTPPGVTVERIETTAELEDAVRRELPAADLLLMAAAPADYRATTPAAGKRPRREGSLAIDLQPTIDVLAETRAARKPGAITVGFALETGATVEKARAKLTRKQLDFIVLNDALEPGAGFEVDTNRVTVLAADGERHDIPLGSKARVAEAILDRVEGRLG
jgi:phosphopantothenoylcysteine decarboxylase/phosphopantothenate--cysteine ligase